METTEAEYLIEGSIRMERKLQENKVIKGIEVSQEIEAEVFPKEEKTTIGRME